MRRLASVFSIVILFLTTFVIAACQEEEPTITFNSSEFIFSEAGGEQQIVNLTSNAQWKVVYHPEWLTVSPQSGSEGTSQISMRTTGNNLSADTLANEIQFQATIGKEKIFKSIRVRQLPTYKRELTARVNDDMLIMSHGIAAVIVGSGSIKTIYYYLYPEQEWQSLSGKESDIEAAAKTKWYSYVVTSSAPAVEHIFTDLQPDSRYHLVTLSYSSANQRGTTTDKAITTKTASQPTVVITPETNTVTSQDGNGKDYKWSTTFEAPSADKYYVYACASADNNLPTTMTDMDEADFGKYNPTKGMAVAWGMYKLYNQGEITDNRDNDNPALNGEQRNLREQIYMKSTRSGTFTFPASDNDKYLQIVAWAATNDGQFSGIITDMVYHVDNGVLREAEGTPPTPTTPHTSASPSTLTFEAAADNTGKTIQVTSNESWTAKSDATWCKVTPASGSNDGIVTVTVTANTYTTERTTNVTIKGTSSNDEIIITITQKGAAEWVDLGLPSGTQWRYCNEGASAPEDYGGYYTFGEVATAPTKEQIEELLDNCTSEWTQLNGVDGRKFTASNGNSIFLPTAGCRWSGEFYRVGSWGYYWSSTLNWSNTLLAYCLYFDSGCADWSDTERQYEFPVRPVRKNYKN